MRPAAISACLFSDKTAYFLYKYTNWPSYFSFTFSPFRVPQIAHRDGLQLPGKTVCGRISYYACDRVTPIYGSIADTLLIDLGAYEILSTLRLLFLRVAE